MSERQRSKLLQSNACLIFPALSECCICMANRPNRLLESACLFSGKLPAPCNIVADTHGVCSLVALVMQEELGRSERSRADWGISGCV